MLMMILCVMGETQIVGISFNITVMLLCTFDAAVELWCVRNVCG